MGNMHKNLDIPNKIYYSLHACKRTVVCSLHIGALLHYKHRLLSNWEMEVHIGYACLVGIQKKEKEMGHEALS